MYRMNVLPFCLLGFICQIMQVQNSINYADFILILLASYCWPTYSLFYKGLPNNFILFRNNLYK